MILNTSQIARNKGKQIAGLRVRIMPQGVMTALACWPGLQLIAVAEQLLIFRFSINPDGKHAHHIRPVRVVANPPEAFRLALCAQHITGQIKPFKGGIAVRCTGRSNGHFMLVNQAGDLQRIGIQLISVCGENFAIQLNRNQSQATPVQHQPVCCLCGGLASSFRLTPTVVTGSLMDTSRRVSSTSRGTGHNLDGECGPVSV